MVDPGRQKSIRKGEPFTGPGRAASVPVAIARSWVPACIPEISVSNSRFRVPHTLVLLFSMVLVAQLLTWVLPQGEFQREVNEAGREEVVAGTYAQIEGGERGPWHKAFTAIPDGFAAAHDIIFFVFLVGGAFAVLRRT